LALLDGISRRPIVKTKTNLKAGVCGGKHLPEVTL
jgi:hypothetical protein